MRSAPERAAVRDFFGLSSPCLPFLFVGEVRDGRRPSTKDDGCTCSDELDFLILRAVWPLVMLVPKSCIFFTDRLSLRPSEVFREASSVEGVLRDVTVVGVVEDDAPLTWDMKLALRPRLVAELDCEWPRGRMSCLLRGRWLLQN